MSLSIFNELESEVRGYIRSFPVLFTKAKGAQLWDENDNEYIDFLSGAGTLNYGHNHPELQDAALSYIKSDGVIHGLDMATEAKKTFMETFDSLILQPRSMNYKLQFTGPTGTNAVEAALKLARQVKGRSNVISFTNGFHGVSGGSLATTGNSKYRDAAGMSLGNVTFMPYCGYFGDSVDTIDHMDRLLSDKSSGVDHPAAVIVETVQGEGGLNTASFEWIKRLEGLCKRHDMLLIVDDIQAGCGRTGSFFSFEGANISPDIITLSKSLSGYGLPMALVLMKPELDIWRVGAHNGTFRGNNLAFVTATETIKKFWKEKSFQENVKRKGTIIESCLRNMADLYPEGGFSVRGRGMMRGLHSTNPELVHNVAQAAFKGGVVVETSGSQDEVLKILAPLVISDDLLRKGLSIIEDGIAGLLNVKTRTRENIRPLKMAGRAS